MAMRIVLINLDCAAERRRRMAAEFERVGLNYEVWPAKDAEELTESDREFVDRAGRARLGLYPIPDGSLANTLSQRAAMHDLVRNGPEMMAVFEDDTRFEAELPCVLNALERRPNLFDIVKLHRRNPRRPFLPKITLPTGHRLGRVRFADSGSQGYIITREAALTLLDRTPRMVREIDFVLSQFWENGLNVLYVDPPIVHEDDEEISQIEGTRSEERLRHRHERLRHPTVLARRIKSTIQNDIKRRLAFRRLIRSDRASGGLDSG